MWCNAILGNLEEAGVPGQWRDSRWREKGIDWVDVQWHECAQRALNKTSRSGIVLRMLLPLGLALRHGDVLMESPEYVVAVHIVPVEVLIVQPRDAAEMGLLALEIGNLHAPAQIVGDELWVIPDGPVEAVLWRMGVAHRPETRRFIPMPCTTATIVGLSSDFTVKVRDSNPGEGEDAKAL